MVSKRTTPDQPQIAARLARAGSMAGALWIMLTAAGCPLREKEIRLTSTGIQWLLNACPFTSIGPGSGAQCGGSGGGPGGGGPGGGSGGSFGGTGSGGSFGGKGGGLPPGSGTGQPGCCLLADNTYPSAGPAREARLFLISPADVLGQSRVQDASKCMSLHPCGDAGVRGATPDCMASDINQQLDGAMPNGLGFDGLRNPEEALVVLAFYQPADPAEESSGCHRSDLYACAGLAAPLGGGAYDISCASCAGGSRTAPGNDNGPCPKTTESSSCFLRVCDEILKNNGFD